MHSDGPRDDEQRRQSSRETNQRRRVAKWRLQPVLRLQPSGAPLWAQRFGSAAEFGETCAFLCSAQAGYITGQNILIDGGAYPGTY